MRPRHLAALLAAVLAVAARAPAASAARWTHCAGRYDLSGNPAAHNYFWRSISVRYVSCHTGREITVRYIKRTNGNPSRFLNRRVHIGGWTCTLRLIQTNDNPYGKVTCKGSRGRQITFEGRS